MNINDFLNSSGEEGNSDMETMDVSLSCDNSELMSSEFFDSVLSLENNMDDEFFPNFEDDINVSSDASSNVDEVLSPRSFYSESDKNSSCIEGYDDTSTILGNIEGFHELISILDPTPEQPVKEIPPVTAPNTLLSKLPTQILIQNPNNKKCISKPMISTTNSQLKKNQVKTKPQILKVQQISNNGTPVLLPLNIKSIKILNSAADVAALTSNVRKRKFETKTEESSNIVSSTNQYPPLNLTNEEKRLLAKEGIILPTHHPLTKNDERELKRIRRKIRNKISAQDSRKRKKEYVDSLEERVRRGSEENKNLLQRVRDLQRQNKTLVAHVNKLQALICNSTTSKATPSTCLMVVLLSALLVSLPNMKLFESKNSSQIQNEQEQVAVRRSLLSSPQAAEDLNMEEFLIFKDEEEFDGKLDELDMENSTEQEITKILENVGKKFDGVQSETKDSLGLFDRIMDTVKGFLKKENKKDLFGASDYGGFQKKGFIEPDIDEYISDDEPYLKRNKLDVNSKPHNENVVTTTINTKKIAIDTKEK
ncbi:cyclic AMP-responsive element-binding protein 3-like protein 3 [Diorhabda sublineata]|uniref:cyclic AMP-responsive element-binding protein 3-like protein 3 n=1 Tax=Diorhabda sublineata TaxID=1163346 RepID=UPI0024E0499C|nr:cyclic AMP-responsive element-binding protein 3-like protein 3 [Diorhabda sublineata]